MDLNAKWQNSWKFTQEKTYVLINLWLDDSLNVKIQGMIHEKYSSSRSHSNFCSAEDIGRRIESQATAWDKMFANIIFDKGLLSILHTKNLSNKKRNHSL